MDNVKMKVGLKISDLAKAIVLCNFLKECSGLDAEEFAQRVQFTYKPAGLRASVDGMYKALLWIRDTMGWDGSDIRKAICRDVTGNQPLEAEIEKLLHKWEERGAFLKTRAQITNQSETMRDWCNGSATQLETAASEMHLLLAGFSVEDFLPSE